MVLVGRGAPSFPSGAVVGAEGDHGVVGDTVFAKAVANTADGAVEGGDAAVVVLLEAGGFSVVIAFDVFGAGDDRKVGSVKPDDGDEGLLFVFRNEIEGVIDDDFGVVTE